MDGDLQWLAANAQEESFLLLVDSSTRDRQVFPDSNYYRVNLERPFYNVSSFEIVQCQFGRSSFHIDSGVYDTLVVIDSTDVPHTVKLPWGDYKMQSLCTELSSVLLPYNITVVPASNPPERTNQLTFYSSKSFSLDFGDSKSITARTHELLGFGAQCTKVSSQPSADMGTKTSFSGPGSVNSTKFELLSSARSVTQSFTARVAGKPTSMKLYITCPEVPITVSLRTTESPPVTIATTIIPITPLPQQQTSLFTGINGQLEVGKTYKLVFECPTGSTSSGTATKVYRNVSTSNLTSTPGELTASAGTAPPQNEDVCCTVDVSISGQAITSPGPAVLSGERYVKIRSPELESVILKDRAYENNHNAGLSFVKLGGFGWVDQSPSNFIGYGSRTISPVIARLQSFTLRFETPNGQLYNTRGVEHALLVLIKFMSVRNSPAALAPQIPPQQQQQQQQQLTSDQNSNKNTFMGQFRRGSM